jgi:membrane-bound lytic murein transglycosylase MltF
MESMLTGTHPLHIQVAILLMASANCDPVGAQSSGYQDATNPFGAAGMMKVTLRAAEYMRRQCAAQFPEDQEAMEADLLKWRIAEASAIRKAEAQWPAMVEREPELEQIVEVAELTMKNNLDLFGKLPPDLGRKMFAQTCRQYFSNLASGVWRERTPKAYKFLDEMK